MKILSSVYKYSKLLFHTILLMLISAFTSCNYWHDDQEGCEAHLRLQFVYDMNMKFADAFAHEVKTVRLHVFNQMVSSSIPRQSRWSVFLPMEG